MNAIRIDPSDATPIWSQIEEGLRRLVASGALKPGAAVPSVRDLARDLNVNPATVAKALPAADRRRRPRGAPRRRNLRRRRAAGDEPSRAHPDPARTPRSVTRASLRRSASDEEEAADALAAAWKKGGKAVTDPIRIESLTVRYGRTRRLRATSSLSVRTGQRLRAPRPQRRRKVLARAMPPRAAEGRRRDARSSSARDAWTTRQARDGPHRRDARGARRSAVDDGSASSPISAGAIYPRWDGSAVVVAARAIRHPGDDAVRPALARDRRRRSCSRSLSATGPSCSSSTIRRSASTPSRAARLFEEIVGELADRRHDRVPDDARPRRLRGHRDARRHPEGGPARPRRGASSRSRRASAASATPTG